MKRLPLNRLSQRLLPAIGLALIAFAYAGCMKEFWG